MGTGERPSRRMLRVAALSLLSAAMLAGQAGATETDLVRRIFSTLDVGAEIAAVEEALSRAALPPSASSTASGIPIRAVPRSGSRARDHRVRRGASQTEEGVWDA